MKLTSFIIIIDALPFIVIPRHCDAAAKRERTKSVRDTMRRVKTDRNKIVRGNQAETKYVCLRRV